VRSAEMHELSLAEAVITSCADEMRKAGRSKVTAVRLTVGRFSGVEPEAFEFAFDVACKGTPCEGAQLELELREGILHCNACGADTTMEDGFDMICPACGGFDTAIKQGREMLISSMEVE